MAIREKSKTTTLLLLVTTQSNCNIQGLCGAGANSDLIALSINDKFNKVYISSLTLEDCYSGRSSIHAENEQFYENYRENMLAIIQPVKNKIEIEFNESNISKVVIFDMEKPSKGFIVKASSSM